MCTFNNQRYSKMVTRIRHWTNWAKYQKLHGSVSQIFDLWYFSFFTCFLTKVFLNFSEDWKVVHIVLNWSSFLTMKQNTNVFRPLSKQIVFVTVFYLNFWGPKIAMSDCLVAWASPLAWWPSTWSKWPSRWGSRPSKQDVFFLLNKKNISLQICLGFDNNVPNYEYNKI